MTREFLTTRQVADRLSEDKPVRLATWQVRRLFETGDLPEPTKFGGKRMVSPDLLPTIEAALQKRGYLPQSAYVEETSR